MILLSHYRAGHCARCGAEHEPDLRMVVDVREPGGSPVPMCLQHLADEIKATCRAETKEETT